MAKSKGRGRPPLHTEPVLEKILELAGKGRTNAEMAEIIGITERTLERWLAKLEDFGRSVREQKILSDEAVEASLHARALGYTHPSFKFVKAKVVEEDPDTGDLVVREKIRRIKFDKHYPPDTNAAIFWLTNRQPDKWRQKIDHKHTVDPIQKVDDEQLDQMIKKLLKEVAGEKD